MTAVKRTLAAPASPPPTTAGAPQTTTSPGQTTTEPDGKTVVGLYDVACDGDCFEDFELPVPGINIEGVLSFLRGLNTLIVRGEVSGEWAVVITQHQREADSPKDDETD